jgi:hypothetical protein
MPVVQRLVMVTAAELRACQTDENALDTLISFKLGKNRYVDLDWSPYGLEQCFEHSRQSSARQEALKLAFSGVELVNLACPEGVNGYFVYSLITCLEVDKVQAVSEQLQQVDIDTLFGWMPEDAAQAVGMFKGIDPGMSAHPRIYYGEFFEKLRAFYQTAAQQAMAVVMWWD